MTESKFLLLRHKYPHIIEIFSKQYNVSFRKALDIFYKSLTYKEISEGISDMHCRSNEYLAEELKRELE